MVKSAPGLVIAAPASGSGKTTVSLALMRAFKRRGLVVAPAKIGPDYIDPGFHQAASGQRSINLDPWGMRPRTRYFLSQNLSNDADIVVVEGVMGLFDGAIDGQGSSADLAEETGWPVLLVMDVTGQATSAAAMVRGFASHRPSLGLAGVLFNRVGGPRHEALLRKAMAESHLDIPILGCLPGQTGLTLESRHLGLVQAREREYLESFLDGAADWIERHADLDSVLASAKNGRGFDIETTICPLQPLGQRIALAEDVAFSFCYPHILEGWRRAGAEIVPFSPLANASPDPDADAVYLPGGYPELYAGTLAGNSVFFNGLRLAASRGVKVFGECGGYMVLGNTLIDANADAHSMAGLFNLTTSFAERRRHLGYRYATVASQNDLWSKGTRFKGHEFHYASVLTETGPPLFRVQDALKTGLGAQGLVDQNVCGSFVHLIDQTADPATDQVGDRIGDRVDDQGGPS